MALASASSGRVTIGLGQLVLQPTALGAAGGDRVWATVDTKGVTEPVATPRLRLHPDDPSDSSSPLTGLLGFTRSWPVQNGDAAHAALLALMRHSRVDDACFEVTLHAVGRASARRALGSVALDLAKLARSGKDTRDEPMLLHADGRVIGSVRVTLEGFARLANLRDPAALGPPTSAPRPWSGGGGAAAPPMTPVGGAYAHARAGGLSLQVLVSEVTLASDVWDALDARGGPPESLWVEVDLSALCGLVLRTPTVRVHSQSVPLGWAQLVPLDGPEGEAAGARLERQLAGARRASHLEARFRVWALAPGAGVLCVGEAALAALPILTERCDVLGRTLVARPLPQGEGGPAEGSGEEARARARDGAPAAALVGVSLVALDAMRALAARAVPSSRRPRTAAEGSAGAEGGGGAVSALLAAAYEGDADAVRRLVGGGVVDVGTASSEGGHTALHWAGAKGHAHVLRQLLLSQPAGARGAAAALNARTLSGTTPLHLACAFNQPEAARVLLAAGADPELESLDGRTARSIACAYAGGASDAAAIHELLRAGAAQARAHEHARAEAARESEAAAAAALAEREREQRLASEAAERAARGPSAASHIQARYRGRQERHRHAQRRKAAGHDAAEDGWRPGDRRASASAGSAGVHVGSARDQPRQPDSGDRGATPSAPPPRSAEAATQIQARYRGSRERRRYDERRRS